MPGGVAQPVAAVGGDAASGARQTARGSLAETEAVGRVEVTGGRAEGAASPARAGRGAAAGAGTARAVDAHR